MNTRIPIFASALLALSINAASAEVSAINGNVGAKYSSDYHRRGEVLSAEALQAQVGFNLGVGAVDVFGDFFTNQSTDSTASDTDEATVGLGTSLFEDSLNAYVGIYNTDVGAGESDLEAFAALQFNTFLSPSVSLYRDTDASLYTYEGQLSYNVDVDLFDLEVAGILGNTDSTATADYTYLGAKVTATKTLKDNLNLYADVSLSDTDTRENEVIWGVGLRMKF